MRTNYTTPSIDVIEIEIEQAILADSPAPLLGDYSSYNYDRNSDFSDF